MIKSCFSQFISRRKRLIWTRLVLTSLPDLHLLRCTAQQTSLRPIWIVTPKMAKRRWPAYYLMVCDMTCFSHDKWLFASIQLLSGIQDALIPGSLGTGSRMPQIWLGTQRINGTCHLTAMTLGGRVIRAWMTSRALHCLLWPIIPLLQLWAIGSPNSWRFTYKGLQWQKVMETGNHLLFCSFYFIFPPPMAN